jgi:hypothetical protein
VVLIVAGGVFMLVPAVALAMEVGAFINRPIYYRPKSLYVCITMYCTVHCCRLMSVFHCAVHRQFGSTTRMTSMTVMTIRTVLRIIEAPTRYAQHTVQ